MYELFTSIKVKWIQENGSENPPPNVEYTAKQLFWISFARFWCVKKSAEFLMGQIDVHSPLFDDHSPEKFRVIGALQNNEEFAKDFNCKVGSYMNPADRCPRIW